MKRQHLYLAKITVICILTGISFSCQNKNEFTIQGEVSDAGGKTMYFEHIGTSRVTVVDSVRLKGNGTFKFRKSRPDAPDFYRLRLNGQLINIPIDSTETVTIHADTLQFAKNYTVEGSSDCQHIKELTLLQLATSEAYHKHQKAFNAKQLSADEYMEKQKEVIEGYKSVARKLMLSNPRSATAYFALFQQIDNLLIFDPYDKDDNKYFGAVATSWDQYYANSDRARQLYTMTLNARKALSGDRPIRYQEADSKTFFEISLPTINGQKLALFESCKDKKVTLVDFTAYSTKESPAHNMELARLYEKYKTQGFEIYQVSLDADEHFWKNAAINLPWLCVRDPQSVNSPVARTYNVKELPSGFIFNKDGEIVKRVESYANLDKDISLYLKQ